MPTKFQVKPTWVEVEHRVLGLLQQVLEADVFASVAGKREIGGHATNGRRCARNETTAGDGD